MKLKEGDIFKINVGDVSYALGQIVKESKSHISIAIFEGLYDNTIMIPDFLELQRGCILFFANTFDAKFYHKHWIIIGNFTANLKNFKFPFYKLGTDDALSYENFEKQPISSENLSVEEKSKINYRNFVAPVRIENAIKAFYKLSEWDYVYNELLYKEMVKSKT